MLFIDNQEHFKTVLKVIENEIKKVEWIGMNHGYVFLDEEGGIHYYNSFHLRGDDVKNTHSYGLNYTSAPFAIFNREKWAFRFLQK